MKKILIIGCTIALIIVASSCQNNGGDCTHDTRTSVGVSFFHSVMDETKQSLVTQPLKDTIRIQGIGNDSLINDTLSITAIRLPLKAFDKTTAFVVQKDKLRADTITFLHENTERFISFECGVMILHDLVDVQHTHNRIDSIKVANRKIVDNKTANQVKIYFKAE